MNRVEFDKKLAEIDFTQGSHTINLEDYLLACLAQLTIYKDKTPSNEIFLSIYTQARMGPKVEFDISWKKLSGDVNDIENAEFTKSTKWERTVNEIRSLAYDLINTKRIRSQPGYLEKEYLFEWDTEGGVRFYNGTTPGAILTYAATRLEGEYPPTAFQERAVTWEEFVWPLWIGISYE